MQPWPAGEIHIANREPDERYGFEAREVIDGGFLELVRYGVRRADDPLIIDSLKVVDAVLKRGHAERSLLASLQPRWLRPAQKMAARSLASARAAHGRFLRASALTTNWQPEET